KEGGADRRPKRDGIIDGIVKREDDAILFAQTQRLQRRCETARVCLQLRIGQRALRIRERDLVAAAARDVGIDEIGGGVVGPTLQQVFEHWRHEATIDSKPSTYECVLV